MTGLGVVILVVALGILGLVIVRADAPPPRGARGRGEARRTGGRRARAGRPAAPRRGAGGGRGAPGRRRGAGRRAAARRRVTPPAWVREAPLSAEEAERRSLALLRSVVNPEEWEMFRDLGFICVTGRRARRGAGGELLVPRYRYLIYPHLPVVALLPRSLAPVREYCVQFPERSGDGRVEMLPSGDDVLAKWMTLRADEDRLLSYANVSNAGCQVSLGQIERDLERLARWEAGTGRSARRLSAPA
jgi:hypothetical protein